MAKTEIYSILDKVAKVYNRPLNIVNRGKAMQVFARMVNDKSEESDLAKWPEQYYLVKLGDYDDTTGNITQNEIEIICNGLDVIEEKNKTFSLTQLFEMFEKYLENKEA